MFGKSDFVELRYRLQDLTALSEYVNPNKGVVVDRPKERRKVRRSG
jgi:hypothetical protein